MERAKSFVSNALTWAVIAALGAALAILFDVSNRVSTSVYAQDKTRVESRLDRHDGEIKALQLDIAGRLARIESGLDNLQRQHEKQMSASR